MIEARFYSQTAEKSVRCFLCNHHCTIKEGKRGLCYVRENHDGKLYSLVYGKLIAKHVDPIEKKPLFHLLPGTLSYSIATVGCNFRCLHCQNSEISQYPVLHTGAIPGTSRTPAEVTEYAVASGCRSISYTYVEPTIFLEFALDTAALSRKAGIKNIFVSNGYTSREATAEIAPLLDANNIDLKSFSDKFYREVCGAKLQPVLDTIVLMKKLGVWVEVTTLLIPGKNDSPEELREIASFMTGVDPNMPWHVTAFHPSYKMTDVPPTPVSTLIKAREIGQAAGIRFVYTGNIPGIAGENTYCPKCNKVLIERRGFQSEVKHLDNGTCSSCKTEIPGRWS